MTRGSLWFISSTLLVAALSLPAQGKDEPLPDKIDFNRDIRPILSDNCFFCHGPDKNKRKADLRLDTREGLFAERDGVKPAVPGKPLESEIYKRLVSDDPEEVMPPPDTDKKLTKRQVALVRQWIEQGAEFQGHWLYLPPVSAGVPGVKGKSFVKNDIDRFVLEKLKREGVKPSPEADRATLVRRLSFDLVGLPPTAEQVEAFLHDTRADAYERLVDELLASPHYGERMAMYWLDLVRYADTVGYHGDRPVNIHPYRDYVIKAFNEDMPFDRFTAEQLAGDLLPEPTVEQKVASGYNRLNMMSEEGGIQDKEYLAKYASDRVRNISGVWMGSTLGCAECHDHKYDPFATKDFYRMAAFFADVTEVGYYGGRNENGNWGEYIQLPTPAQGEQIKQLDGKIVELQQTLNTQTPELDAALDEWHKSQRPAEWAALKLIEARSSDGATLTAQPDGSILASGSAPEKDTYTLTFTTDLKAITAFRLEVLPDPTLPGQGPGRSGGGNFVVNELELMVNGSKVALVEPTATFEQANYAVVGAVDGDPATGWAIMPQFGKANHAVFQTGTDLGLDGGTTLTFTLRQQYGSAHTLGKFRLSATANPRPNRADTLPPNITEILKAAPERRDETQKQTLAAHFRSISPLLQPTRDQLAATQQQRAQLNNAITTTLVTVTRKEPRMVRILPRGNWMNDSGEVVEPGVPHFLPQIEKEGRANRLDLAHWLTRADNPLTARVFANRLWKLSFGHGLSRNIADMGSQGDWPTHPELLDYLATEFVRGGWGVKRLHKMIVMSGTYRQSSLAPVPLREKDPFNRLYARQSRFRLDAEMIRDNALALSGLLVGEAGGPSAKPYQPPGYYSHLNFPVREYEEDKGANQYRRGVYTWWQRQYLHPSLLAFDAPSREECTADRPRSNTPLQALVLLNDPTYVEAARVFAERVMREGGGATEDRLAWAVARILVRVPTERESAVLRSLYEQHLAEYRADPSGAEQLLTTGQRPAAADLDKAELAAWTGVTRTILNLNETITRN